MAVEDTILFLRERVSVFDPEIDTSEGSDFYAKVLKPLLGRLGTDLFTTDTRAFLHDILSRNFPQLALGQLDALTEALILPVEVALGPVTAEITRVQNSLSMRFPDQLTVEEAEALGANHLEERRVGNLSRGLFRIYFSAPQPKQVDLTHVFTTSEQLAFVPTQIQSILASEMLFNQEGSLYFFDVNVVATAPGEQYNLEPHQSISVQNLPGAVKITNPNRFRGGLNEQTAEEFVSELPDKKGQQGMTQPTGIVSTLTNAFPALTRISVVGFGDPDMQRDLLQGESLGKVLAAGFYGQALGDNEGRPTTKGFAVNTGSDGAQSFTTLPTSSALVLTLMSASFVESKAVDVAVDRVLSDSSLLLAESVIPLNLTGIVWMLRNKELRMSKAPGLLPGEETAAPPDKVHVGGAVDTYLRAASLTSTSTIIDTVDDNSPVLSGLNLTGNSGSTSVRLRDLTLNTDYQEGSSTQRTIQSIWQQRWALQILEGPAAGIYDILNVTESNITGTTLTLYSALPAAASGVRWRILDDIDIDLRSPRLLRWSDDDLETSQGLATVTTTGLTNFLDLGVEEGDTFEITKGQDKGTYTVVELLYAGSTGIRLNQPLTQTASQGSYLIYKESSGEPLETPLVRITDLSLLDPTGQALGVKVPYGRCLGAMSRGITNPARGVKFEVPDALLGLISDSFPSGANVSGERLELFIEDDATYLIAFSGSDPVSVSDMASQVNAAVGRSIAAPVGTRLGIFPVGDKEISLVGPTPASNNAVATLFGARHNLSTKSVRSPSFTTSLFDNLSPALSFDYDVLQFKDGLQTGVASIAEYKQPPRGVPPSTGLYDYLGLVADKLGGFFPEADVRLELGSRSLGVVRAFFLEPVTVEFGELTRLKATDASGVELVFKPDASFSSPLLPPLPRGTKAKDGNCVGGDAVLNSNVDFRAKRIRVGDQVVVDYAPITGGVLADPVPSLAGKTLFLSFGSASVQRFTFMNDDTTIPSTHVTRAGVLSQLNRVLGANVASLTSGNVVELNPEYLLVLGSDGSANSYLGLSTTEETTNRSLNAGTYTVVEPGNLGCVLDRSLSLAEARMQFSVLRPGAQRMGVTSMQEQGQVAGLYYMDLEVVSEGTGDLFNLPEGTPLTLAGYFSDGFDLSTPDSNYSFSPLEEVHLHVPRQVNAPGTNDDPEEATVLQNLQLQVTAETAPEVREVDAFLRDDGQRDIGTNPLALSLTPHLVFFEMDYQGGPEPDELRDVLSRKIHALFPGDSLAVDDIVTHAREAGVVSITMPLTIYAVVVDRDRQLRLIASQDRLEVTRHAAFYPHLLTLRRRAA